MVASTGHKEHESEVFGALASHLSAEGAGLAGGPSLGAPKAKARRFHVVARSLMVAPHKGRRAANNHHEVVDCKVTKLRDDDRE